MYYIENSNDGRVVDMCRSYERALIIREEQFKKGVDTYIRREND